MNEIESQTPRMFSLQKLVGKFCHGITCRDAVELADFNMDRIRFVWTRIWNVLAAHFTKVNLSLPNK